MKIMLVRPPAPNKLSFTKVLDNEPLELEYLHTEIMRLGFDDYIYDGLIERESVETVMARYRPDILAVTGYITQEKLMIKYCRAARKLGIKTLIGGVHAQLNYRRLFDEGVDYIMRSESMPAFGQLVTLIAENAESESALRAINGLCFKNGGAFEVNPLIPISINELPIPDRSFFDKNKGHYRYLDLTEIATIKTSFACPYDCSFCYCTLLGGGKYQERDLALVIEELKTISSPNVQIADDDFMVSRGRIFDFVRMIKENGINKTFICYGRADFIAANPDAVEALAGIGFKYFLVGLEAVTDDELQGYNKRTSLDDNRRCVQVINATKTAHPIGLMIAPIDATKEYFENLYRWIVDNGLKYVTVSIFTPIPGTPLYEAEKHRITSSDIEDWDFLHLVLEPENMSRAEFYYEYYRLFLRLYRLAAKTGIYDFMDLPFYRRLLGNYLRRKAREG